MKLERVDTITANVLAIQLYTVRLLVIRMLSNTSVALHVYAECHLYLFSLILGTGR